MTHRDAKGRFVSDAVGDGRMSGFSTFIPNDQIATARDILASGAYVGKRAMYGRVDGRWVGYGPEFNELKVERWRAAWLTVKSWFRR